MRRAVVEHVPDREQVIKRLAAALRPGGWLLIEDVDFGGATAGMLARVRQRAARRSGPPWSGSTSPSRTVFAANGADPSYGSRLIGALAEAGLAHVAAELHAPVVSGGNEQWTRGSIEQLAERLVATGEATADDIQWFLAASAEGRLLLPSAADGQRVGSARWSTCPDRRIWPAVGNLKSRLSSLANAYRH